jgi:hypothetical protein
MDTPCPVTCAPLCGPVPPGGGTASHASSCRGTEGGPEVSDRGWTESGRRGMRSGLPMKWPSSEASPRWPSSKASSSLSREVSCPSACQGPQEYYSREVPQLETMRQL